jgi:Spy/CpxP family protein refolding chaperone
MATSKSLKVWSVLSLVAVLAGCGADASGGPTDSSVASNGSGEATGEATGSTEQKLSGDGAGTATSKGLSDRAADRAAGKADRAGEEGGRHGRRGRGHRGPPGPDFMLTAALHDLTLTDAQKTTIEAALEKARPAAPPQMRGDRTPFAALAAGVRAGKVDATALAASMPEHRPDADRIASVSAALETLHATLSPEQRRTLVDTISKRAHEHGPGRGPDGAHHAGPGRDARGNGEHHAGPGRGDHRGGPLGHMLAGLDLTEAQRTSIDKIFSASKPSEADHEAMKQRFEAMQAGMKARLESFAADSFDAKAFAAPPAGVDARGPRDHAERMGKDLSAVVAVLEPAQREKLATMLESGPPSPMGRGMHHRGQADRAATDL